MKDLMKMIMKNKGESEEMSPEKIKAKMDVIQELLDMAGESQGKGLAGKLQKVSVMAPDKESLLEGMNKAQDLVEESPESEMMEEESEEDESPLKKAISEALMKKEPESMEKAMVEAAPEEDEDEAMSFDERRKRKMMARMKEEND